MVWGTYALKIEVQMAFAQVGPEIKCPRVPVLVKGGGQSLFGQCPNRPDIFQTGASLSGWDDDDDCAPDLLGGQWHPFPPVKEVK